MGELNSNKLVHSLPNSNWKETWGRPLDKYFTANPSDYRLCRLPRLKACVDTSNHYQSDAELTEVIEVHPESFAKRLAKQYYEAEKYRLFHSSGLQFHISRPSPITSSQIQPAYRYYKDGLMYSSGYLLQNRLFDRSIHGKVGKANIPALLKISIL